jgi:hypothetical protein
VALSNSLHKQPSPQVVEVRWCSVYLTTYAKNNINAQAVIVLTDGYLGGDWGAWTMPLLWGILDNKSARPTIGKTLHINL